MTKPNNDEDEDQAIKVEKWDQNAVRLALDDGAKKIILETDGFEEDFHLIDARLIICTTAVMFSLFALLWDFMHPFPKSRPVLIICVVSYFLLMGVLTLYSTFKEKNIFLVARQKDKAGIDPDIIWTLSSTMPRFDSDYSLKILVQKDGLRREAEITKCVGNYIDTNGELVMDKFEPVVMELYRSVSGSKKKQ